MKKYKANYGKITNRIMGMIFLIGAAASVVITDNINIETFFFWSLYTGIGIFLFRTKRSLFTDSQ